LGYKTVCRSGKTWEKVDKQLSWNRPENTGLEFNDNDDDYLLR
jgi:hypothetical protein